MKFEAYVTGLTAATSVGNSDLIPIVQGGVEKNATVSQVLAGAFSSVAITGGTVDGTAIGGTTPAAGYFTSLAASGALTLSASGTALSVTNNATIGGVATVGSGSKNILTLTPGAASTNAVTLSTSGGIGITSSAPIAVIEDIAFSTSPATTTFWRHKVNTSVSGQMPNTGGLQPIFYVNSPNNSVDSSLNANNGYWQGAFNQNFGGTKGGQGGLLVQMSQTSDLADTVNTMFVNPLNAALYLNHQSSPGGTLGYAGNAIAAAWSTNLGSGAKNWGLIEASEEAVTIANGATFNNLFVHSFLLTNNVAGNAGHAATGREGMVAFGNAAGATSNLNNIFVLNRGDTQWVLDPTNGAIMSSYPQLSSANRPPQSCALGFDLWNINFGKAALRTSGVSLGNAAVTVGAATISEGTNGPLIDCTGQIGSVSGIATAGAGYVGTDQLYDGLGGIVSITVNGSGNVTAASYLAGREPYVVGTTPTNPITLTGGSGNGAAAINVTWTTKSGLSLNPTGQHIGFNGTAPVAKPTVTGSKASNAALASFISAMAAYGLLIDSTT